MSAFSYNTVLVKVRNRATEEFLAEGVITPGHLIDLDPTDGDVIVNQAAADPDPIKMFAIEDALQGRGIDDDYADNDQVMCYVARPGDIVFALLEDTTVVTQGTSLESAGDGTLQVRTTGATIGKALEALTASGVTRCKIMIT
jgi:hypothetical protein